MTTKKGKSNRMTTFGERLYESRKRVNLNQEELGKAIGASRQYISFWETGSRSGYQPFLDKLSEVLGVDKEWLATGISAKNQTVNADLGLNDEAVEFLRSLSSWDKDYPLPIMETDSDEIDAVSPGLYAVSPEFALNNTIPVEAVYPEGILSTINLLLTTREGKTILSYIDFYLNTDYLSCENRQMTFSTIDGNRKYQIPSDAMNFALGQGILYTLEELRHTLFFEEKRWERVEDGNEKG